jgi:hypothetical protein
MLPFFEGCNGLGPVKVSASISNCCKNPENGSAENDRSNQ